LDIYEIRNFDWTAHTYDIYWADANNPALIQGAADMDTSTAADDLVRFWGTTSADKDIWIDNFLVRNYVEAEPTWGGWGGAISGALAVTTNAATYITQTTARLNGYVNAGPCDIRFQYNTTTLPCNASNCTLWTHNTTWVNDTYTTGDSPYNDTVGLASATSYCFRIQGRNAAGIVNGTALCFTTITGLSAPTNFKAYPDSHSIDLTWLKGVGSTKTVIAVQVGGYPANYTSGTLAYNGTLTSITHSGLSPGVAYYYRAWAWSSGNYSGAYANVTVATMAGGEAGAVPAGPDTPGGWWQDPDYRVLSNVPLYSIINDVARDYDIPPNTAWVTGILLLFMGIGLFIYSQSHNINVAVIFVGVLIFMAATAKLMPMWFMVAYAVPAISIMAVKARV